MALTYSAIAAGEIDPDSPITTGLMTKLRDNPLASHKYVVRTIDGPVVTNSTTLQNDGVLQFSGDASQVYVVRIVAQFTNAGNDRGVRTAINIPGTATISAAYYGSDLGYTAVTAGTINGAYFTTTDDDPFIIDDGAGNTADPLVLCDAVIIMGDAGNVTFRYAQGSAQAATSVKCDTGSFLAYHRVDSIT